MSTGDINQNYTILCPIYFQISNRPQGFSTSKLQDYVEKYKTKLEQLKDNNSVEEIETDCYHWETLLGEWYIGEKRFEAAFHVAIHELKEQAKIMNADGIIYMRQDIDLDNNQFFYLQMYGTAVKFI